MFYIINLFGDYYKSLQSLPVDSTSILFYYLDLHDVVSSSIGHRLIINELLFRATQSEEFDLPVIQSIIALELYTKILLNENCDN